MFASMLVYLLFILGFVLLVRGAPLLITGATTLAYRLRISDIAIGLTVIAFGTSMPELAVNIIANVRGADEIAIGNVIGSTITTILVTGAIAAIIRPLTVDYSIANKQLPLGIIAVLTLALLANDFFLGSDGGVISRVDGLILLAIFGVFVYYLLGLTKISNRHLLERPPHQTTIAALGSITLGVVALALGGHWVVLGAVALATDLGISQSFVGLIIVSLGTSLPEIMTSIVASLRGKTGLALGNLIGSITFNTSAILGLSTLISPLTFDPRLNFSLIIFIAVTFLLSYFILAGRRERHIERWEGVALLCAYLVYICVIALRG